MSVGSVILFERSACVPGWMSGVLGGLCMGQQVSLIMLRGVFLRRGLLASSHPNFILNGHTPGLIREGKPEVPSPGPLS